MKNQNAESIETTIHSLHYKLIRITKPLMLEHGILPHRYYVLKQIKRKQPVSMGDLKVPLHITKSTLTSLVDGLVRDGFVERYRGEQDRRKVFLKITTQGVKLLDTIHGRARSYLGTALKTLKEKELEFLLTTLEKLNHQLDDKLKEEEIE